LEAHDIFPAMHAYAISDSVNRVMPVTEEMSSRKDDYVPVLTYAWLKKTTVFGAMSS
jgi:hypothetical protein